MSIAPLLHDEAVERPARAAAARTLQDVLLEPGAVAALRRVGAGLRAMHAQRRVAVAAPAIHGPREETEILVAWLERMILQAPGAYAAVGERGRVVLEQLDALRTPARRVIHGRLDATEIHLRADGTVVLAPQGPVTLGDPVVDLGTLTAQLEAAVDPAAARILCRSLLAGYGAPARWAQRLAIYSESARLRMACIDAVLARTAGAPLVGA